MTNLHLPRPVRDVALRLPGTLAEHALLLDVDGTLLDLAPTPREVAVPEGLRETLAVLHERTGGAIAFVSGRRISELDLIFAPLRLPAIGGHGAECRLARAAPIDGARVRPMDAATKRRFAALARIGAGILVEDKRYSIALHYRLAPALAESLREAVAAACAVRPGGLEILEGKFVIEIKQAGYDKASAVRDLMTHPPFTGRRPVFIGDDTTDEVVFPVIPEYRGIGISVGRRVVGAQGYVERPADVRAWLERLAAG